MEWWEGFTRPFQSLFGGVQSPAEIKKTQQALAPKFNPSSIKAPAGMPSSVWGGSSNIKQGANVYMGQPLSYKPTTQAPAGDDYGLSTITPFIPIIVMVVIFKSIFK